MDKAISVIVAVAALLTTGFQQAKDEHIQPSWVEFSPKNGGFSIMMPDKPPEWTLLHETAKGQASSPLYQIVKGDFKYLVSYMDYPFSVEEHKRDKLLELGAEAGIAKLGVKVVSNTPISLESYPGREVKGELGGILYRSRVYLVRQRLYLLIIWMPPTETGSENAAKFLESFKLVAR